MERFHRFANNAGFVGTLQSIALLVLLLLVLRRDAVTGQWVVTLPACLGACLLAFVIRDFLVDHVKWVKWVMNGIALVGILFAFVVRDHAGAEPIGLRAILAACFGLYLGSYFWLLSDSRIGRVTRSRNERTRD